MDAKPDIRTTGDVCRLVEAFYADVTDDPVIGPYFEDVDLDAHRPKLCAFWSSVVFQTGTYRGRPFEKHVALEGLAARHFARWLRRFVATVDAHHAGPRAERMKERARQIATVFQIKLGVYPPEEDAQR